MELDVPWDPQQKPFSGRKFATIWSSTGSPYQVPVEDVQTSYEKATMGKITGNLDYRNGVNVWSYYNIIEWGVGGSWTEI